MTRAAAIAGHVWSAPLSIAGVLVASLAGARTIGLSEGALELEAPARGPLAAFFRVAGVRAYTWGAVIVYRDRGCRGDAELRRHERVHVAQCLRFGLLMPLCYGADSLWQLLRGRHPYRDNSFEVRARVRDASADLVALRRSGEEPPARRPPGAPPS